MNKKIKDTTEFDKAVGLNLRIARMKLKISQGDLADMVGVTFQQLQKYENGSNRVSIGRANDLCQALKIDLLMLTSMDRENVNQTKLQMLFERMDETNQKIVLDLATSLASIGKNKSVKD